MTDAAPTTPVMTESLIEAPAMDAVNPLGPSAPAPAPAPNAVTLLKTLGNEVRTASRDWHPDLEESLQKLYPGLALAMADLLDRLPILLLRRLVSALFLLGAESGYPAFRNFTFQASFDPRTPREVEGVFLELATAMERAGEPLVGKASKLLWALEQEGRLGLQVYEDLVQFVQSASIRPGQVKIVNEAIVVADESLVMDDVIAWATSVHDQVLHQDPKTFMLDARETIVRIFGADTADLGLPSTETP